MPRKVRELAKDLTRAGFRLLPRRGKGSHRWYVHPQPGVPPVNLAGKLNGDAKRYQENDVHDALEALG